MVEGGGSARWMGGVEAQGYGDVIGEPDSAIARRLGGLGHLDELGVGTDLTVGLRGSALYGAVAEGDWEDDRTPRIETSFSVSRDRFYPYFDAETPAGLADVGVLDLCDAVVEVVGEAKDSGLPIVE